MCKFMSAVFKDKVISFNNCQDFHVWFLLLKNLHPWICLEISSNISFYEESSTIDIHIPSMFYALVSALSLCVSLLYAARKSLEL